MKYSLLLVCLGGIFGSAFRFLIATLLNGSPNATIIINLSGCFLIGALGTTLNPAYRLFLITGILGSFTTFSTFGLESFSLLKDCHLNNALAYITLHIIGGISMVYLGELFVGKFFIGVVG